MYVAGRKWQLFKTCGNKGVDWHLAFCRSVSEYRFQKLTRPKILIKGRRVFYWRMCSTAAFVTCFVLDLFWGPFIIWLSNTKVYFWAEKMHEKGSCKICGLFVENTFSTFHFKLFLFYGHVGWHIYFIVYMWASSFRNT